MQSSSSAPSFGYPFTLVVGFYGPPRAGKDTMTSYMVDYLKYLGYDACHMSLGSEIKKVSHTLVGLEFDDRQKDNRTALLNGHSPRELYIHVGQLDVYRPALWSERVAARVKEMMFTQTRPMAIVIDSIGKQPQWDSLVGLLYGSAKMMLVGIERPGAGWVDNRTPVQDDKMNFLLVNDGSLGDLKDKTERLVSAIVGGSTLSQRSAAPDPTHYVKPTIKE